MAAPVLRARTKNSANSKRVRYKSKARSKRASEKKLQQFNGCENEIYASYIQFSSISWCRRRKKIAPYKLTESICGNESDADAVLRDAIDCCRQHANVACVALIQSTRRKRNSGQSKRPSAERTKRPMSHTHTNG